MRRMRWTGDRGSCAGRLFFLALLAAAGVAAVYWARPDILLTETVSAERAKEADDSESAALIDAEVDHPDIDAFSCTTEGFASMTAVIDLTNRGDRRASYIIGMVFESPDGDRQVGTGSFYVSDLEPGQTVTKDTSAFDAAPDGGVRCRINDFLRSPP